MTFRSLRQADTTVFRVPFSEFHVRFFPSSTLAKYTFILVFKAISVIFVIKIHDCAVVNT